MYEVKSIYRPSKKRQFKNQKYGFGGQKKRSKFNTKETSADMSQFDVKVNQGKPGFNKSKKVNLHNYLKHLFDKLQLIKKTKKCVFEI